LKIVPCFICKEVPSHHLFEGASLSHPPETTYESKKENLACLLLLGLISIAYCAWILSLPLFPTQDGPMHLYYARIMQALLFHREPGIFPQYFVIKHLFPPYSLYYYLLLALSSVMSLVSADKVVICLYVVLFLFGFRYLARSVGREGMQSGNAIALLITPIVLNWPLGMGFVNFCLSSSLSLWALGLWCRVSRSPEDSRATLRLAGFVVLCFVIMLTHPVPLLGVLGFCCVELGVRLVLLFGKVRRRGNWRELFPRVLLRDAVALLLAGTTLIYVKAFTTHNVLKQIDVVSNKQYLRNICNNAPGLVLLHTFTAFAGHGMWDLLYRGSVFGVLAIAVVIGIRDLRRSLKAGQWSVANTWLVLCLLLIVVLPIIPPELNGSHFFSARLVIFVWIAGLVGAAGVARPKLGTARIFTAASVFAVVATGVILMLAIWRINPIARQIAVVETMPVEARHQVGALLHDVKYSGPRTITYDPYYWSGVRIFRRQDSIVYNTPWLDLAIIPVGAQPTMATGRIDSLSLEWQIKMRKTLLASGAARTLVFTRISTAVINHGATAFGEVLDPVLAMDPVAGHRWSCRPETIYTLCSLGSGDVAKAMTAEAQTAEGNHRVVSDGSR
jgi:hypothetical protein